MSEPGRTAASPDHRSGSIRERGASPLAPRADAIGPAADILALQRSAGNRAVDGLLRGRVPPDAAAVIHDAGRPLDPETRAAMEPRFGRDFGRVRVHDDDRAAASAQSLAARAYAVDRHVVFGRGRYAPGSREGRRLIAHELAHVVQQTEGGGGGAESAEGDAARAAEAVDSGRAPDVIASAPVGIQREPLADAEIDRLQDEGRLKARLLQNEAEYQAMVWRPEMYPRLEHEHDQLNKALARLRREREEQRAAAVREAQAVIAAAERDLRAADRDDGAAKAGPSPRPSLLPPGPPLAWRGGFDPAAVQAMLDEPEKRRIAERRAEEKRRQEEDEKRHDDLVILLWMTRGHGYAKSVLLDLLAAAGGLQVVRQYGCEPPGFFTKASTYQARVEKALTAYDADWRQAHGVPAVTLEDERALAELRRREAFNRAWTEGLGYVTTSFTAAAAAEVASHFTDDPRKVTAAAGLGTAASGVFGSFAGAYGQQGSYSPAPDSPTADPVGPWRYRGPAATNDRPTAAAPTRATTAGPEEPGPTPGSSRPGAGGGGRDVPSLLGSESETGGFHAEGPPVAIPADKAGRPARVLEVGSGPRETDLGLPADRSLVDVTPTDLNPRPGAARLDATADVPPWMRGQYDAVIINNPRRYVPDIARLGEALRPGGRVIVQGKAEAAPRQRGINPDFQRLLKAPAPPGYKKIIDVEPGPPSLPTTPADILGGPFFQTTGAPAGWPNARIIYEKLPDADAPPKQ